MPVDESVTAIYPASRQFTEGSPCFIKDHQGRVRAHQVVSCRLNHLNRRVYSILVDGYFLKIGEGDSRLLTGFEPDFPDHDQIDWSDYHPIDVDSEEHLQDWEMEQDAQQQDNQVEAFFQDWQDAYDERAKDDEEYQAFLEWERQCFGGLVSEEQLALPLMAHLKG